MNRFTVAYDQAAESDLAQLVIQHWGTPAGREIAAAAKRIDKLLTKDPLSVGSPILDNLRLLYRNPLEIVFAVFEEVRRL